MVSRKQSRHLSGSFSRATLDPQFTEADDQATYQRYKMARITITWSINLNILSYPVLDLFAHTSLSLNKAEKPLQYSLSPTRRGGVPSAVFTLLVTVENLLVFLPPGEGRVPSRSTDVDEPPP
ncbi:hypothetical protein MA16_Dca022692 [Dendrobium catenatum]|uniref:Uncharacterized protein n=1 Tax=Dendrobium catenatum TaxID=906689 RepID=A0A2I0VM88_9ASPA|nr:hypothetical protein MA16_Dca022692 [Dendrobium catenatum]